MTEILYCQIGYATIGLLFNMTSWIRPRFGKRPFTATKPVAGILSMMAVFLVTLSYPLASGWIYRIGWVFLILRLTPSGVLRHIKAVFYRKNLENYSSAGAAYAAAGINTMGVITGIVGLIMSFSN